MFKLVFIDSCRGNKILQVNNIWVKTASSAEPADGSHHSGFICRRGTLFINPYGYASCEMPNDDINDDVARNKSTKM